MGTAANVLVGAATVKICDWTSSGGGTPADLGYTAQPVSWQANYTNTDITAEQAFAPVKSVLTGMTIKVKVSALETTLANLRIAMRLASAQVTATSMLGVDPVNQYHRVQFVGPAVGTYTTRTVDFWKCMIDSVGEIQFSKSGAAVADMTFSVVKDDTTTATTQGNYYKIVDS